MCQGGCVYNMQQEQVASSIKVHPDRETPQEP